MVFDKPLDHVFGCVALSKALSGSAGIEKMKMLPQGNGASYTSKQHLHLEPNH
jgi:hypothetical protein